MGGTATHLHHLIRLPPRVAVFYCRALLTARHTGDAWSLEVSSRPPELRALAGFHDYGDPAFAGVAEAVSELGLFGEMHRRPFVWHKP